MILGLQAVNIRKAVIAFDPWRRKIISQPYGR